jgi:asparagine synthase (glutamine-hydrolysing)
MCGICGIVYFDPEMKVSGGDIRGLNNSQSHRGPDDEGYFLEKNIGLGHRRLSIIDLERGHQPIFNEDRSVVVILNGEIYNFHDLRKDLSDSGHRFSTDTDTETLVHGYEAWGIEELLSRCNGMYAFCLYDIGRERLFLVRDRLGKKPLYYSRQNDRFLFSSEIRGLMSGGFVSKRIDPLALSHYVQFQYSFGENSLIRDVKRVLPGHYLSLSWRHRKITKARYWVPEANHSCSPTFPDCCDRLRSLLDDSVRLRSVADVPVGTFLSGGLDSSIVAGLLAERVRPLNTFSIGFEEPGFDESPESALVSSHFHTNHHHLILTSRRFSELLQEVAARVDEPVADAASIPTYWLSREARKTVKVVLTGEGSDELFAGYEHYSALLNRPLTQLDRLNTVRDCIVSRRDLRDDSQMPISGLSGFPLAVPETFLKRIIHPDYRISDPLRPFYRTLLRSYRIRSGSHLDQALMADMRSWLVDDILMKLDKMSMLNSLEIRAPFLDYRLVEFALTVPDEYRVHDGIEKYILRESYREFLPKVIIGKKKQGFNLPMKKWLREDLSPLLIDFLSPDRLRKNGFLNEEAVSEVVSGAFTDGIRRERLLFTLLMLQMWWEYL